MVSSPDDWADLLIIFAVCTFSEIREESQGQYSDEVPKREL